VGEKTKFYTLSLERVLDNRELAEWLRVLEDMLMDKPSRSPRVAGSKPERTG
jgi:hypothetical protein